MDRVCHSSICVSLSSTLQCAMMRAWASCLQWQFLFLLCVVLFSRVTPTRRQDLLPEGIGLAVCSLGGSSWVCCGAGHLEPRKASAVPADPLALLWSAAGSTGWTASVCSLLAVLRTALVRPLALLPCIVSAFRLHNFGCLEEVLVMWAANCAAHWGSFP